MKHKQFIVAALLAATLLSGCGNNQATEVMAPVETQEEQQVTQVDENWYQNKVFQNSDTGFYCWVEEVKGNLCFLISGILDEEAATCVAIVKPDSYDLKANENGSQYLQFNYQSSDGNTVAIYEIGNDQLVMAVGNSEGQASALSGTYENVTDNVQQEQPTQQPDLSNNTEFPEFSRWECFETFSGEGITISIEVQSGDPVMILPEAQFIVLERNGADTGWEFINEDFTDSRVYTTVTYYGDKLVISSTEDWKWDGTYIQLPDTTE